MRHFLFGQRIIGVGIKNPKFPAWLELMGIEEYEIYFENEDILRKVEVRKYGKIGVYAGLEQMKTIDGDVLFAEGNAIKCLSQYCFFRKYERIFSRHHPICLAYAVVCFLRYFISGRRLIAYAPVALKMNDQLWFHVVVRHAATKRKKEQ
ncbi:hypothetical protein NQX30_01300 [Candidatus Persebacteraceae bacterium Df01]|jgi:hypothetical protein|uniref:Uncharacterized protein n=1 Tax=Candidatus Doriopsillibacter californiensis TaxID=2970740 RepID=A0ABT7QJZ7_9GAMM|nr:hypothetical protein [Candidatus Persebacteraceae bacterium Df01]